MLMASHSTVAVGTTERVEFAQCIPDAQVTRTAENFQGTRLCCHGEGVLGKTVTKTP